MGVPGLWDLLRPAATRTSLSTLAREAFCANKNGLRALTIGIDASIWIFHAQVPQYGENPFLRTIFFKITSLLQQPVLPVFVFDGPNKPSRKRGERVAGQFGTSDYRSRQFKDLLDACGLEWWNAPGEAEAELAVMSRQGKIDAVLSDDVDALLFGATCLLRNNSPTLSGAQASSTQTNSTKSDLRQYEIYRSSAIVKEWTGREGTSLETEEDCRMAMVWIALLGGGDYAPEGLSGFGPTITYALANAGLASFLRNHKAGSAVDATDAARVHAQMIEELQTNASGHLGRRYKDRAAKLGSVDPSSLFPTFALDAYLRPSTSPLHDTSAGWPGFGNGESVYQKRGKARNEGRGDLTGLARACERFFEWGTKDLVAKKFASESVGLFGSELVNCARQRVRLRDPRKASPASGKEVESSTDAPTTSGSPVSPITSFFRSSSTRAPSRRPSFTSLPSQIVRIHSVRQDPTNPVQNEYRVSFSTTDYIERCHDAMDGHRVDPKDLDADARVELGLVDKDDAPPSSQAGGSTATQEARKSEARVWIAEYLVKEAWPELVEAYEAELAAKAKSKTKPKKPTKKTKTGGGENAEAFKSFFLTQRPTSQARSSPASTEGDDVRRTHSPPPVTTASSSLSPPPIYETVTTSKKNARRAPASSSSSSSGAVPPTSAAKATAPVPAKLPSPPRRNTRRSARTNTQQARPAAPEIIDLCSSDEEVPSRPVLAAINKANTPPPAAKSTATTKGKAKGRPRVSQTQTLLGLPVVRPGPTAQKSAVDDVGAGGREASKGMVGKVGKQKAPLFVVTYEDEERVELDVRGRWARGESVGVWEDVDTV